MRFSVLAEYCDFPDLAALGGFEGVENVEVLCLLRNGERDFCRFRPHFRASLGFYEQGGLSAVGFGRERHVRDIGECRRVPVIEFGGVLIRAEVEPPAFPVAGGFVGVSDICGFPHIERGGLLFHFHIPEMELSERMFKAEVEARVRRVVRDADQNFYFLPVEISGRHLRAAVHVAGGGVDGEHEFCAVIVFGPRRDILAHGFPAHFKDASARFGYVDRQRQSPESDTLRNFDFQRAALPSFPLFKGEFCAGRVFGDGFRRVERLVK